MNRRSTIRGYAARRGLTLIELMVAVSLLCIMIVAFSMIVAEARKVVSTSQASLRANTAAVALEQAIRDDIRRATQNGFLCISTRGGQPAIYCATAGPAGSMTDWADPTLMKSNGKIVAYAVDATGNLVRGSWLIRPEPNAWDSTKDFWWSKDIADFQIINKGALHAGIIAPLDVSDGSANDVLANVTWPPTNSTQIANSWKFLAANVSGMTIQWTDGTTRADGSMNWYGASSPRATPEPAPAMLKYGECEHRLGGYHALWTKDDPSKWPKAIKINFTITDPGMPAQVTSGGTPYEIVVAIDR